MNFVPDNNVRSMILFERLLLEADRMLPENERIELLELITKGEPDAVITFISGRLPVADILVRARA